MLTPDMKSIVIMVITRITPVPKSGWSIINPNNKITIKRMGRTEDLILLILLLFKYFEVKMMIPSLANSLGCIPKDPIPNQLLEPFLTEPIPGIKTKIKRMIQIKRIILLYL